MKIQLLRFIANLNPEKQLTIILVMGIVALFGWVKILTGNDTIDRKAALMEAEKKCETEKVMLRAECNRKDFKIDSLINKAAIEKQQTIDYLQRMLETSQQIKEKVKKIQ